MAANFSAKELLARPELLSDWAVQAGLLHGGVDVTDDDFAAAIALREAIYRTVTARIEHRRPKSTDVALLNEHRSRHHLLVGTDMEKAKVRAFQERQRASETAVAGTRTKG